MLRKYRYLAVGLALTVVIVLGCFFIPGVLLHIDSSRELGKIQQADQLYYADNVNASDAVEFDLSTRLLMKSGQWKSEKTQITQEDVFEGDVILPEEEMRLYGGDIFSFLAIGLWSDDYYIFDVANAFDEAGKDYIHRLTGYTFDGSSMENAEEEDGAKEDTAAWEDAAGENMEQYGETKAAETAESFLSRLEAAAYEDSLLKLYKYEDKVLNSYYFYMWEYRILNEELGIDVCFEIDAVTLEVYNISFHGSLFDSLPWIDAMNVIWDYRATELNTYYHPWNGTGGDSSFSAISPTVTIPAFVSGYWMGTLGYTVGFASNASFYNEDEILTTRENGYSFGTGNFMMSSKTTCSLEDASDWLRLENEEGDFVYANFEGGNGGFDWYLAAERA